MINVQSLTKEIQKGNQVFIADTARVIGMVKLGDEVSVWYGASIRGDADQISIGSGTNIQDNAVVHTDEGIHCSIGENCIIGHCAIVHGAKLANNVLVGMNATILNHANIGEYSIIAAGAVIPEGMIVPPYSLVVGIPGKVIKKLDENYTEKIRNNAENYRDLSKIYLEAFG